MKRLLPFLPLLATLCGGLFVAKSLLPARNATDFDLVGFARLPILANGRIKPFDTVARTSLLELQNRQRVSTPEKAQPFVRNPTEWLLDMFFRPEQANTYPTFAVDNPDVLHLIGKTDDDLKIHYTGTAKKILAVVGFIPGSYRRFPYNDLRPHLEEIQNQARLADQVDSGARNAFQRAVLQLYNNLRLYQGLQHALVMPGQDDFLAQLLHFQDHVAAGVAAVRAKEDGKEHDEAAVDEMTGLGSEFLEMSNTSTFLVIPPEGADLKPTNWKTAGAALLNTFQTGQVDPTALAYAGLQRAWRQQDARAFNQLLVLYRNSLDKRLAPQLAKAAAETRFNAAEPFYTSMVLYAGAFFVAIFSWLLWPDALGRAAFWLTGIAWVVATVGIGMRMWLEGRPPVTNLYSSALFVGWGSVALCLVLEWIYRNAIGSVAAGAIGFSTLLIAHHLALGGDTLEMMRAVLDSNFWLATHVVVVTTGYAATFLAGFLAIIYVVRGVFTKSLDAATASALTRMVYGIVCFATLFSFTGTVLGGIWADQSWGRFWGWDPKENGALIIVIWNALILHARWGGLIKQRGLMCLAIFGNVVTSWSWFGTNMLGVGLHSYGFTQAAFVALSVFVASQIGLIALANLPLEKWRSFRRAPAS
ncbi:MAG TPA: cytochrome c biogenesis protein CcsA [Opitutus sp.]|nr:cytochrome c biogenesis protein CcsA [Opitutus sp.]